MGVIEAHLVKKEASAGTSQHIWLVGDKWHLCRPCIRDLERTATESLVSRRI
jgi:hypothetical protein